MRINKKHFHSALNICPNLELNIPVSLIEAEILVNLIDLTVINLQFNSIFFLKRNLQKNALDKLEARAELSSSGKINLKVKLAKTLIKNNEKLTVSVDANATGEELIHTISERVTNFIYFLLLSIVIEVYLYLHLATGVSLRTGVVFFARVGSIH